MFACKDGTLCLYYADIVSVRLFSILTIRCVSDIVSAHFLFRGNELEVRYAMKTRVCSIGLVMLFAGLAVLQACGGGDVSDAPPMEIVHPGVIVRINAGDGSRKPYLRCDVVIQYADDVASAEANRMTRLSGNEGKSLLMRGLMRDIATAEEIEADQIFHMEEAGDSIREVLVEEGFPSPLRVLFSSWVIQG